MSKAALLPKLLDELESLILRAKTRDARERIHSELVRGSDRRILLPPALRARAAGLCRYAGLPELSLRILEPVVRPRGRGHARPSEAERLEYASALAALELPAEADELAATLDVARVPEVLRLRGQIRLQRGEPAEAAEFFGSYLAALPPGSGQDLQERKYIAWALVLGRLPGARGALEALERDCWALRVRPGPLPGNEQGWAWYRSEFAQMRALLAFSAGDFEESVRAYVEAEALLSGFQMPDTEQLAEERRAVSLYLLAPRRRTPARLAWIQGARDRALAEGRPEHARSLELHLAALSADPERAARVWYGTPGANGRALVLERMGQGFEPSAAYELRLGGPGPLRWVLDLGADEPRGTLVPGRALYRLLMALLDDFYRPRSLAALYGLVFPGRLFQPRSSRAVLQQLLHRLRRELAKLCPGLGIRVERGRYALRSDVPGVIRIPRELREGAAHLPAWRYELERLRKRLGKTAEFSSARAAEALGISLRSANVLIAAALEQGLLSASGRGRARRYGF